MKQKHYGAIAVLALFGVVAFVETLPLLSAAFLAGIASCLIKGRLWEIEEERGERVDSCSEE